MAQTTIAVASNGQALPGTGNVIHVASTTGFASSGIITIYLTSTGFSQEVNYTGTTGGVTPTFTGCTSNSTDIMTTGDFVVDNVVTVEIAGEYKRIPANGIEGNPTSAYGEYSFFTYGQSETNGGSGTDDGYTIMLKSFTLPFVTTVAATRYYQMVGFYVTGAVYEAFVVTGSPTAPSVNNPNTGHALINTYVSSFWTV
jgi:hypothetical protein